MVKMMICRLSFNVKLLMITCVVFTGLNSCTNYKKITYFKNISDSAFVYSKGEKLMTGPFHPLVIHPDDNLKILISTLDPQMNNTMNLNENQSDESNSGSSYHGLNYSNNINGFLVDKLGNIDIPIIGKVHVEGLTTADIKDVILKKSENYFKNPIVNVRLTNFKVTVLGEVSHPGTYVIDGERANVLDALGLAGDMTIYGKRENVMLMRIENGENRLVARFNLNDSKSINSPFFYLKQGDILYVEPSKGKAAATDLSATKTYAILGSLISVIVVIVSRL